MLDITAIPALRDNYIWLIRHGRFAVVVDPGDATPVIELLDREQLALAAILITHHHQDHQGGVATLQARYGAAVFGPAKESITGISRPLIGEETIRLDALGVSFDVFAVPGHTLGHLAFYGDGCLFCGDTLFGAGCGRLFEGTPSQMHTSLNRLAALPGATRVFPAHEYTASNLRFAQAVEPQNRQIQQRIEEVAALRANNRASLPSSIDVERSTNPFLRCDQPAVIAAARQRQPAAMTPIDVFTAIRAWKDVF